MSIDVSLDTDDLLSLKLSKTMCTTYITGDKITGIAKVHASCSFNVILSGSVYLLVNSMLA